MCWCVCVGVCVCECVCVRVTERYRRERGEREMQRKFGDFKESEMSKIFPIHRRSYLVKGLLPLILKILVCRLN